MRIVLLLAALALASPAPPQPTQLTVTLSNFEYTPRQIRLVEGRPYVLTLVNRAPRKHNFVAPAFFAAAGQRRAAVEVRPGGSVDVAVTAPAAGRYPVKCTHFAHALLGMKGEILVDRA